MWGAVSARGATSFCLFNKNLRKEKYIRILQGYILPTAQVSHPDRWILQQDKSPKRWSHRMRDHFATENLTVLPTPSYSPDPNLTENILAFQKDNINKKKTGDVVHIKREAIANWDNITHILRQRFAQSMSTRVQACLANRGEITKYWFCKHPYKEDSDWLLCDFLVVWKNNIWDIAKKAHSQLFCLKL